MTDQLQTFVFKNRGALLSVPAVLLSLFGKPSAFSVAAGLPLAFLGEALRCWAVGYSGATTRSDRVEAPKLVTAGPYAYVRNPLYLGNFITAAGFTLAFTGRNSFFGRAALAFAALGSIAAVYSMIIPHEEQFLQREFGDEFTAYCDRVPPIVPLSEPAENGTGEYDPDVLLSSESKTFVTFGAMLAMLALKSIRV
ncbi:MAG: isoprenylcysteine carboxylmethyltransferase family protein [Candidatus Eremiobacteraeota bacterium]|nr:isoprenylcysteine carboxylmethyltransferase family protein [Candidatus Eremiobacteraeota bacterium]